MLILVEENKVKVLIDNIVYVPKRVYGDTEPLEFNVLIKEARQSFDETLEYAASNIGIAKSHLHTLEGGTAEPRLRTLQAIIRYYGIPFERIK